MRGTATLTECPHTGLASAPSDALALLAQEELVEGWIRRPAQSSTVSCWGMDWEDLEFDELARDVPEPVRMRMAAVDIAVRYCSTIRPRWSADEAVEEVLSLAETILDEIYGGREERLAAMPYGEYLQTPEWDARRKEAYRRADYRCQLCNASGVELNAHHRAYVHRGRPAEAADLIVLCKRCHSRAHEFIWKVDSQG